MEVIKCELNEKKAEMHHTQRVPPFAEGAVKRRKQKYELLWNSATEVISVCLQLLANQLI